MIKKFIHLSKLTDNDSAQRDENKRPFLFFFLVISICMLVPFGIWHFLAEQYLLSLLCLSVGVLQIISLILFCRFTKNINAVIHLNIFIIAGYLLFLVGEEGYPGSKIYWIFIFPMATYALLGQKMGFIWNLIVYVLAIFILTDSKFSMGAYPYPSVAIIRFACVYAVITIMGYIVNTSREEYKKRIKDKYHSLVNTMNEGLIEVDKDWLILYVNTCFADMTGYSKAQIVNRNFRELVADADKKIAEHAHKNRLQGKTLKYELELIRSDGKCISVLCSPKPYYDKEGNYMGGLGVITDITELKLHEDKQKELIEKLQKTLSEIKTLRGIIPICSHCKKIRDDKGFWLQVEKYVSDHSDALFSHGICPDCMEELYSNEDWYDEYINEQKKDS